MDSVGRLLPILKWEVKVAPSLKTNLMLGAVVGLVLGGAAAFICEALDNTISTPEALQRKITSPLAGYFIDRFSTKFFS